VRSIFGLFGRSPFGPLSQHTERVHDTVVLVRPLLEAFMDGDWEKTAEVYAQIRELEHRADLIKNDIRDHLPRSLFMPVDRGDILQFLRVQDKIADSAEDIGVLLTMRKTPTPEPMKEGVLALVDSVIATSEAWFRAAKELPALEEASFTGPEVEKMLRQINEVRELERLADRHQAEITKQLFEYEKEIGALSIMLWMNIFRVLGLVANNAESTADLLRLMLAKR
jgi:predicted phosphate transport protein (TIGR00153 family)